MFDLRIKGEKFCNLGVYVKCFIFVRVFLDCVVWGCKGYIIIFVMLNEIYFLNFVWKEEFGMKVFFFINVLNGFDWKWKWNDWKWKFLNGFDLGL